MQKLDLVEIYNRGMDDFASLSPLERDVFVVHDLNLYYEMEGGFEDYLLSGGHSAQLEWLVDTLQRAQDHDSSVILSQLMEMTDAERDSMSSLCHRFYDLMDSRWGAVERYLYQQGAVVA